MGIVSAVAIYFIGWWLVLFAVLPMRVATASEAGEAAVPGQADSAPARPMIWWKLRRTTLITTILFVIFYANYTQGWLTLADLPWLKRPEAIPR